MKSKVCAVLLLLSLAALSLSAVAAESPLRVYPMQDREIRIHLETPELIREAKSIEDQSYDKLSLRGATVNPDDGLPELPLYHTTIAIPARGSYVLEVRESSFRELDGIRPYPVIPDDTEAERAVLDSRAYSSDELFPSRLAVGSDPAIIRDFRVIHLSINPVQWHAASGRLRVYDELDIRVRFTDEEGINEMPEYSSYSPAFEKLYSATISNFADYRLSQRSLLHARVLIIYGNNTDPVFLSQLQDFVTWKKQKGFDLEVVSTLVSGTSNTAIKSFIQNRYDNIATRPDFIILLGDTTGSFAIPAFIESYSSYGGGGDYPYTHLAGNDTLGDVFIGRISAENISQLGVLFAKIYAYERDINNDPASAGWLNRMVLIGDPSSSGISTMYVNKFIKELALQINPGYNFIENYSGGYSSTMNSAVNLGVGFFNYRGYIGMSGWNPSSSLINGAKMPHATILTCSTGNYWSGTATSEAFMRLGTAASPAGAITAIGMSTSGTHTMFNNTLNGGIYDGILTHHMRTMGEANLSGRLYLASTYGASNPTQVNYFAHWCNLMGDPTVEVFVGIPGSIGIIAANTLPAGTHLYDVQVIDDSGVGIEGVSITLWSNGQSAVVAKGFSDEEGRISINMPGSLAGSYVVTASRHDLKPVQQTLTIDTTGALVYSNHTIIDDGTNGTSGNSNSFANAGETVGLQVSLLNSTSASLSGISATLSTDDPSITITNATVAYPEILSLDTAVSEASFIVSIDTNVDMQHDSRMTLTIEDSSGGSHITHFHLSSFNAGLDFGSYTLNAGGNSILDPAETGILQISVHNQGNFGVQDVWGELISLNDLVEVTDNSSYFGAFTSMMSTTSIDGFGIFGRAGLVVGMQIPFTLRLYNDDGFEQRVSFNIPVGTPSQNTPLGPDAYGYFIYDETDVAYPDCPTYEWIEVHPGFGGSGTLITGYNDSGSTYDEGDQVGAISIQTVNLPFAFGFYGVEYNQISVCTNGFIAMGVSTNAEFRNYRLPGAMGPSPMIAAFWDDMALIGDAGIYKYFNEAEHYFVIQYHKMRNGYNLSSEETFQVIFYDPLYYPTGLGDGMIKIQYKVFNNIDTGGGGYTPLHGNYATIGIKDHTNTRGLEYSYNNTYPPTAAPLAHQRAILITTEPVLHENAHLVVGEVIVNDLNANGVVEPGEEVEIGVKLNNIGLNAATEVTLVGAVSNPYVTVINNTSEYSDIAGSGSGVNISPIKLLISENCPNNHTVSLICNVSISGNSWQYPINFTVHKPALSISKVYLNDSLGNGNGLAEPGETIKLIVNYQNSSTVAAKNVSSYLNCLDPNVTLTNLDVLMEDIPAGATAQAVYEVQLGQGVILGNFITFYITYLGELVNAQNQQIMLSVGATGMSTDFEQNDGEFVPSPLQNGWQWGGDAYAGAHSGVAIWGTRLNAEYQGNQTLSLTSPPVYIGPNYVLEFWHRYQIEAGYDGGNVSISQNNGSTWTIIHPEGGYPTSTVVALGQPGYSGDLLAWTLARFNLSSYSNQEVRFKWTFASDGGVQGQGWFIDDVQTSGYIDFAALAHGIIETGNPETDFASIYVKAANNTVVHPNSSGSYKVYLPTGAHSLNVGGMGYEEQITSSFSLSLGNPDANYDFYLPWFKPVSNAGFTVIGSQVILSWDAPLDTEYPVLGYNVHRRVNAGRYELIDVVSDVVFSQSVNEIGSYSYFIEAKYATGDSAPCEHINFSYPYVSNEDSPSMMPTTLYHNYPNPFNPETTISFHLAKAGATRLSIFNMRGQLVKTLMSGSLATGTHSYVWNGRDDAGRSVASGVYFYRLQSVDGLQTKKAILVK